MGRTNNGSWNQNQENPELRRLRPIAVISDIGFTYIVLRMSSLSLYTRSRSSYCYSVQDFTYEWKKICNCTGHNTQSTMPWIFHRIQFSNPYAIPINRKGSIFCFFFLFFIGKVFSPPSTGLWNEFSTYFALPYLF